MILRKTATHFSRSYFRDSRQAARLTLTSRLAGLRRSLASADIGYIDEEIGHLLGPIQRPRNRSHGQDSGATDHKLLPNAPRVLHEDPVRRKRQEHAEAEDRERVLAAQDHRPQPFGSERWPI